MNLYPTNEKVECKLVLYTTGINWQQGNKGIVFRIKSIHHCVLLNMYLNRSTPRCQAVHNAVDVCRLI